MFLGHHEATHPAKYTSSRSCLSCVHTQNVVQTMKAAQQLLIQHGQCPNLVLIQSHSAASDQNSLICVQHIRYQDTFFVARERSCNGVYYMQCAVRSLLFCSSSTNFPSSLGNILQFKRFLEDTCLTCQIIAIHDLIIRLSGPNIPELLAT